MVGDDELRKGARGPPEKQKPLASSSKHGWPHNSPRWRQALRECRWTAAPSPSVDWIASLWQKRFFLCLPAQLTAALLSSLSAGLTTLQLSPHEGTFQIPDSAWKRAMWLIATTLWIRKSLHKHTSPSLRRTPGLESTSFPSSSFFGNSSFDSVPHGPHYSTDVGKAISSVVPPVVG